MLMFVNPEATSLELDTNIDIQKVIKNFLKKAIEIRKVGSK